MFSVGKVRIVVNLLGWRESAGSMLFVEGDLSLGKTLPNRFDVPRFFNCLRNKRRSNVADPAENRAVKICSEHVGALAAYLVAEQHRRILRGELREDREGRIECRTRRQYHENAHERISGTSHSLAERCGGVAQERVAA